MEMPLIKFKTMNVQPQRQQVVAGVLETPMSSVAARYRNFLSTGGHSDLTIIVGKSRTPIKAHKMILIFASAYFEENLGIQNGKLQSNITETGAEYPGRKASVTPRGHDETLVIEDVETDEFDIFLKFIYGGDFSIKVEEAMPLLICATKFKVPSLVKACTSIINQSLQLSTALTIFRQGLHYNKIDVVKSSTNFICKYAYKLINQEEFCQLSVRGLQLLLERDDFEVYDEMQLFEAVLVWAKAECLRKKKDQGNPKCLRSILGPVLKFIRFPQMKPSEFALKVPRLKILTSDEVVDILPYFHVSQIQRETLPSEFFISRTRNYHIPSTPLNIVKRLNLQPNGTQGYPCGSLTQIKFKVTKCVWIKSIGLSPSAPLQHDPYRQHYQRQPSPDLKLSVKAEIRNPEDEEIIFGNTQDNKVSPVIGGSNCVHVEFKKPVRIQAGLWYLVALSIEVQQGQYNSCLHPYALNGKVQCDTGVIFEFQNTDNSTQQGRQIPELGYQFDD